MCVCEYSIYDLYRSLYVTLINHYLCIPTESIGHAESWPTLSDQSTVTAGHHSIVNIADIGYIDASDDEDEEEEDQAMPSPHHTS